MKFVVKYRVIEDPESGKDSKQSMPLVAGGEDLRDKQFTFGAICITDHIL